MGLVNCSACSDTFELNEVWMVDMDSPGYEPHCRRCRPGDFRDVGTKCDVCESPIPHESACTDYLRGRT